MLRHKWAIGVAALLILGGLVAVWWNANDSKRAPEADSAAAMTTATASASAPTAALAVKNSTARARDAALAPDGSTATPEQAVLVHLRLVAGDAARAAAEMAQLQELELRLEKAIARAHAGELDGNEVGDGEYVVVSSGPDADKLFLAIEPVLRASSLTKGGFVLKRYGEADDEDAREVRTDL